MGLCSSSEDAGQYSTSSINGISRKVSAVKRQQSSNSVYRAHLTDELFNPIKRRPSSLHLETLLETKVLRESFAQYLRQTNSADRKIGFWLDCRKYEMMPYDPPSLRISHAQYMYDSYFENPSKACSDLELDITVMHDILEILKV
jgi:hypothetical protein